MKHLFWVDIISKGVVRCTSTEKLCNIREAMLVSACSYPEALQIAQKCYSYSDVTKISLIGD